MERNHKDKRGNKLKRDSKKKKIGKINETKSQLLKKDFKKLTNL